MNAWAIEKKSLNKLLTENDHLSTKNSIILNDSTLAILYSNEQICSSYVSGQLVVRVSEYCSDYLTSMHIR